MASQSLYRKWRSQTFDEMVGQEPIIRTLKNALSGQTLSHAYLFTGPRGTGKTTTARLLAKTVNCTNPRDGEPCNECQQCREITAGTSFNVIEIDAASNRGIDNIRELRDKVMMPPSTGRYKIYILDEAHMLTTEAFNALLKTLEEPPDYAIFVLATTDVHKMLPTVLSRCQRFDFKRISTRQIVEHLMFVAREEKVELEPSAAGLIARAAAGGMRDALSLLDQAIAYAGEVVALAQVQSMLGVADPRAISKLITCIADLNSPALLYLIHELSEAGADLRQVNAQVVEYWRALLLAKAGADIAMILDLTEDEVNEVKGLLSSFTLEELTECARIFAQNDLMQKNQATPQLGLELASLECLELHRRVQAGEPAIQQAPRTSLVPAGPQPPAARQFAPPAPPARQNVPARPATRETAEPGEAIAGDKSSIESFATARQEAVAPAASAPRTSDRAALTMQQVAAGWENVKKRTRQKSNLLGTYIGMCDVLGVEEEGESAVVVIRAAKPSHHKFIREEDRPKEVEWALSMEFGITCKLRVLAPDQPYTAGTSQGAISYSLSAVAAPPSAHRERPQSAPQLIEEKVSPAQPHSSAVSASAPALSDSSAVYQKPPLARPQGVKENKRVALSQEEVQQKARQDPVVQEVVKLFGAKIKNIQPK